MNKKLLNLKTFAQSIALALTTFCLIACSASTPSQNDSEPILEKGALVSSEEKATISLAEINAGINQFEGVYQIDVPFSPMSNVEVINIDYGTITPKNTVTKVSARVYIPKSGAQNAPIVVLNHGTHFLKSEAPTVAGSLPGIIYATTGYIAVLPDYIGYGSSTESHPYLHAKTSAQTVIDAINATKELLKEKEITPSNQLFMTGYSQGGFVTMAAAKWIEETPDEGLALTAIAPNAGPYDLENTMRNLVSSENVTYPTPANIPFIVFAYDDIYELSDRYGPILTEAVLAIKPLYNGQNSGASISAQLPSKPRDMFTTTAITLLSQNTDQYFNKILAENTVYKWVPKVKMRIFHSQSDKEVPIENTQVAINYFKSHGASDVEWVDPAPNANHQTAYWPCQIQSKLWFDTLVQ